MVDIRRARQTSSLVLVAALLSLTLGSGTSLEAASRPFSVVREKSTGSMAFIEVEKTIPATCADGTPGGLISNGLLTASQNVTREDGTKVATTAIELSAFTFDLCTGAASASNGVLNDAGSYQQKKTDSATVSGVIPLKDMESGMAVGSATVDLAFTSSGPASQSRTFDRFFSDAVKLQITGVGTFAPASATGTLAFAGTNLLVGADSVNALLGTNVQRVTEKTVAS